MGLFQVNGYGIIAKLRDGEISVDRNLILLQKKTLNGKIWELAEVNENNLKQISETANSVVFGSELTDLLKAVANGDKKMPLRFQVDEFKELITNTKFCNVARLIPGMETKEHQLSREKISGVKRKLLDTINIIGKGLPKIKEQGYSGRFVGENQEKHFYWLREIVFHNKIVAEVDIISEGWLEDKESNLSIKEWETSKKKEWEQSSTELEFLPWIKKQAWDQEERAAWQKENPQTPFSQEIFSDWKNGQTDNILILPKWLLTKFSGNKVGPEFDKWRDEVIIDRKENWEKFRKETGLDISFEDHEKLEFEHSLSGSLRNSRQAILIHAWKESKTEDSLPIFIRKLEWNSKVNSKATSQSFEEWNKAQDLAVIERYQGSGLPITFEKWQTQQDDSILNDPAPFISLNEKERTIYCTDCNSGKLTRNMKPLDSSYEKTLHSGPGYAIFVIGPDQDLYTASHIGGVFHHSSFLGDGAVMAAGEIKTDKDGNITELSAKSGHYRPTDAENLFMLNYFKKKGVDLSEINFTTFTENGKTEEYNAAKYLTYLEHKNEIAQTNIKIKKCKSHINRLSSQRSHCKAGKKGRAKQRSLSEQIAVNERKIVGLEKTIKKYAPR